jgi:hypothetical protein
MSEDIGRVGRTESEIEIDAKSISDAIVGRAIDSLKDSKLSWWSRRQGTIRSRRHVIAWVKGYLAAESGELDDEFVSDEKSYHFVMISDVEMGRLRFCARLTTSGLTGWTEYGIEIRRVGAYFFCKE